MSQVHYRKISLEDLIRRSDVVLVVKTAKPAQRQVAIPVGTDQKNQEAPAFARVLFRCEVQRVLSASGVELAGKTIEIDGAHWEESLSLHKRYYLEGMRVSPIYEQYQPDAPLTEAEMKDAPYIVFLRRPAKSEFAFVVSGALERLKNRAAIEALLKKKK